MDKKKLDIQDDDFRVIGKKTEPETPVTKRRLWRPLIVVLFLIAAIAALLLLLRTEPQASDNASSEINEPEAVVFEPMTEDKVPEKLADIVEPLGDYSDTTFKKPYTEHLRDTINDIPVDIYIPHNATPELVIGVPDIHDKSIVMTTQAADIRADNGKIVGAFVSKGTPLSWGLSKKGYCGIIDGKVTVGVSDNSPLFEEATEKGGHFFRQYPLVDNGKLVENEPKGKSIRKALCDRNGEIMVVMTQTPESFHDFAQALVDMKVDNAIYLVGSSSFGYFRDCYDHLAIIYNKHRYGYKYENFIIWR